METSSQVPYEPQTDVTTALHLSPDRGDLGNDTLSAVGQGASMRASQSSERTPSRRPSRAEERKAEVERKRAEKRELEAQKKHELEEKLRLEVFVNYLLYSSDVYCVVLG